MRTVVSMATEMNAFLEGSIAARVVLDMPKTSRFLSLPSLKWIGDVKIMGSQETVCHRTSVSPQACLFDFSSSNRGALTPALGVVPSLIPGPSQ